MNFFKFNEDDFIQIVDSKKKIALVYGKDSRLRFGEMNARN